VAAVIKPLDNPFFAAMRDGLLVTAKRYRAEITVQAAAALEDTAGQASAESEPTVLLQFSLATTKEELREVRELLASSPGRRRVQLLFDRPSGEPLRVDAGADLCVELTSDLEQKLVRWLVTTKAERRGIPIDSAA